MPPPVQRQAHLEHHQELRAPTMVNQLAVTAQQFQVQRTLHTTLVLHTIVLLQQGFQPQLRGSVLLSRYNFAF